MNRAEMMQELVRGGHDRYASSARPKTRRGISDSELRAVMDAVAGVVRSNVVEPLSARVDELAARVAALEARPELLSADTWKQGETYTPNALVVDSGALWICRSATEARPGETGDWLLVVRGRT